MKKILINYADEKYRKSRKVNSWTGKHIAGFDRVIEYAPEDIDESFYEENRDILNIQRGNGLWLWKPYFIYKSLCNEEIDEGDFIFYCDSGSFFIRGIKPIIDIVEKNNIWVSTTPLIEKQFTKKQTFELMNCKMEEYGDTAQIQGGFIALKKCTEAVSFVKMWLTYCCNPNILMPPEDTKGEEIFFLAHREDQSVLSLLVKQKHIGVYQDPTQYGKLPEKYKGENRQLVFYEKQDYKPIIILHRGKRLSAGVVIRQLLCALLPRKIGLRFINQ